MRRTTTATTAALAALTTAGLLGFAAPAATASHGGGDARVIRTGDCSGSATWKLKVKSDDGRLEVEGEVDSNRSGQKWAWTIKDDGVRKAAGTGTTAGRSGSFSVERKIANRAGKDTVVFRAVRNSTGQVCQGTVTY